MERPTGNAVFSLLVLFTCTSIAAQGIPSSQERPSLTVDDHKLSSLIVDDQKLPTAYGLRLTTNTDGDGFPNDAAWQQAPSIRFDTDCQGKNPDPARETEVRILWTPDFIYFRFRAKFRSIKIGRAHV